MAGYGSETAQRMQRRRESVIPRYCMIKCTVRRGLSAPIPVIGGRVDVGFATRASDFASPLSRNPHKPLIFKCLRVSA
jgi:hypothetical protein